MASLAERPVRVLVVDDHPVVREGLRSMLAGDGVTIAGEAASGEEALNRACAAMKVNGSTVVVVAHRPSLMSHIDQVLLLQGGQMQMVGPRDTVLAQLSRPMHPTARPSVRVIKG